MKKINPILLLLFASTMFAGCELVGDILEFGIWVGVIIVVAIIALVLWIWRKIRR